MYVAAIFLKHKVEDVHTLTSILMHFGEVTDWCTNRQKTSITAISRDNIILDRIMAGLPVKHVGFLLKYMELPLSIRRLKKRDFRPIVNKLARRLVNLAWS